MWRLGVICDRPPKARFLITGMSATARKRKEEVAQALKKLIQAKGKMPSMKYMQLLDDLRGQSETVNILIASVLKYTLLILTLPKTVCLF